jgi:LytTr DNA-binding domain
VPTPTPDLLQRYLAHRRPFEVGAWVLATIVQIVANTTTTWLDVQRNRLGFEWWQVASWELSSNAVWLALVPVILAALRRWPLHWGLLRRNLPRHLVASLVVSGVHVVAMVLIRKALYATQGQSYDFGPWWVEWPYEALKDVRTYALVSVIALGYRLLLWRLQGEASLLQPADDAPSPQAEPEPEAAERFLVRKLGKEFLLPAAEIEWVQACGNYVNLHRRGHDYPLRSTLAAIEKRLDARFVRVHRSWVVNLALVDVIEPTEAGDARVRMKDGAAVPCSRTHLDGLRQRLR